MRLVESEDDEMTSQSSAQDLSMLTTSMMTIRRFKDCVHDYSELDCSKTFVNVV